MNCYQHQETEALTTCEGCNIGLCSDCDTKYEEPLCDNCKKQLIKKEQTHYALGLTFSIISSLVFYFGMDFNQHHGTIQEEAILIGLTTLIFFISFSFSRGTEDLKKALQSPELQKAKISMDKSVQKAQAKGEKPLIVLFSRMMNFMLYALAVGITIAIYGIKTFFVESQRVYKSFKLKIV